MTKPRHTERQLDALVERVRAEHTPSRSPEVRYKAPNGFMYTIEEILEMVKLTVIKPKDAKRVLWEK